MEKNSKRHRPADYHRVDELGSALSMKGMKIKKNNIRDVGSTPDSANFGMFDT